MPFKSEAQRRKFFELERQGKIKKGTTAEWNKETKGNLPERIGTPSKATKAKALKKRFGV